MYYSGCPICTSIDVDLSFPFHITNDAKLSNYRLFRIRCSIRYISLPMCTVLLTHFYGTVSISVPL